jgi:protein-disulfide isomerase/uncharacterized membrane protein
VIIMRQNVAQVFAILLAVAAGWISYQLLEKHLRGSSGIAWFDDQCEAGSADADKTAAAATGDDADQDDAASDPETNAEVASNNAEASGDKAKAEDRGRQASCDTVLKSDYGVWPPRLEGDDPDTPRIPVAFLGMLYYSFAGLWVLGVGVPSRQRAWIHFFPVGMVGGGLLGSAYFTYIMFTVSEAWCPWCLVTHILNLLLGVSLVLMWPKREVAVEGEPAVEPAIEPTPSAAAAPAPAQPRPTGRQVVATLAAMGVAAFGLNQLLGKEARLLETTQATANFDRCMTALGKISADGDRLVRMWRANEKFDIPIDLNRDVIRKGTGDLKPLPIVVFSDFECPHCGRFAEWFEEHAQPMFDGNVSMVWKHYPGNIGCNPLVGRTIHPQACKAAYWSEAARMIKGNDGFWAAHDYLFAHRKELGKLKPEEVSMALSIEPSAFEQALMQEEKIRGRILEDLRLAKSCKVKGTPAVFISGRRVESMSTKSTAFWSEIADMYWRMVKKPRPPHTYTTEEERLLAERRLKLQAAAKARAAQRAAEEAAGEAAKNEPTSIEEAHDAATEDNQDLEGDH